MRVEVESITTYLHCNIVANRTNKTLATDVRVLHIIEISYDGNRVTNHKIIFHLGVQAPPVTLS